MRPVEFIRKFVSDLFNRSASRTLADGTIEWRRRGELHRESGPAVIHPDGREDYYLEGWRLSDIDCLMLIPIQFEKETSSWSDEWKRFKSAREEWERRERQGPEMP
jgi:hypothetical protein